MRIVILICSAIFFYSCNLFDARDGFVCEFPYAGGLGSNTGNYSQIVVKVDLDDENCDKYNGFDEFALYWNTFNDDGTFNEEELPPDFVSKNGRIFVVNSAKPDQFIYVAAIARDTLFKSGCKGIKGAYSKIFHDNVPKTVVLDLTDDFHEAICY